MDLEQSKKFLIKLCAFYCALVIIIYVAAYTQFRYWVVSSDTVLYNATIGELIDGTEVRQKMEVPANHLESVSIFAGTYGRQNTGTLIVELQDDKGTTLTRGEMDISLIKSEKYTDIPLRTPLTGYCNQFLTLCFTTEGCEPGNAITLYMGGNTITGRFDLLTDISADQRFSMNDVYGDGMLCIKLNGFNESSFYITYWVIAIGLFLLAALIGLHWWNQIKEGKNNPLALICTVSTRYKLLIKQLVSRDFKTKYKRSTLGMAWSFLNPLLTMSVQYLVFSTLFKTDIDNYPIYLLTGIVFMNFFNEAINMCMTSITGNAALIKKVYMPKYIFPMSRIISSLINFMLAILPLFIVMLITRTPYRISLLLLIYDILCMLGFVLGMGLLLSTAMCFFQDTQFLWSVISMMWLYMTPVFYPESIIPKNLLPLFHANPMYQYITFARICIINGTSPNPMAYLWCMFSSIVVLVIGLIVFKKNQDKFIMYL